MIGGSICLLLFTLSLVLTMAIEKRIIPLLRAKAPQPIYTDGPAWHITKSGTPTMGGVGFILPISLLLLCSGLHCIRGGDRDMGISLILTMLYSLLNSFVGIFDDIVKLKRKSNGGLSPLQKLGLQSLLAIIFLMARKKYFLDSSNLTFSFGDIDLGVFYYPFAIILLLFIVNCANLTDGIDGLASWVAFTISVMFLLYGTRIDTTITCTVLAGGALGFLYFNSPPAKIFMGDTGSLFLGATVASLCFSIKNPFSSLFFGFVYVIEGLSVILQVAFFKLTKKRLFRMAPIHHHLEKCGVCETRVSIIAIIITVVFSSLCRLVIKI